jgi:ankyrin repeat protein
LRTDTAIDDWVLLGHAAEKGAKACIDSLLAKGEAPTTLPRGDAALLHRAATEADASLVKMLLARGIDPVATLLLLGLLILSAGGGSLYLKPNPTSFVVRQQDPRIMPSTT